jgi:hypothetical protein
MKASSWTSPSPPQVKADGMLVFNDYAVWS